MTPPWLATKPARRQVVKGIRDFLKSAFRDSPRAERRVIVSPFEAGLPEEVVSEHPWRALSPAAGYGSRAHAGVVIPPPGDAVAPVAEAIGEVLSLIRPGGSLIVATSVTSIPGEPALRLHALLEVIQTVSGGRLQLESLASQRWAGEHVHRGALLRFTVLGAGVRQ